MTMAVDASARGASQPLASTGRSTNGIDVLQAKLKGLIERSGALLPPQGPLGGFAFLNPLQGLEELPFEAGMMKGARLFGCRPYLVEDVYREKLATGRIVLDDLKAVLRTELAETASIPVAPSGTIGYERMRGAEWRK